MRSADDAVSPVISVILMVAIVVILGSVVSVFALGLAESVDNPAPSASFEFKVLDNGDIEVTHASGDTLDGDQLRFAGAALEKTSLGGITEWSGGDVTSGDSATVNVEAGETLRLIWQSPDSDQTATVGEYDVPDDVGPSGSVSITNVQSVNDEVSVSVGTLSKISGNANLVVEAGSSEAIQTVSSGATPTLSLSVDETETVTATLYESGRTGEIASDTGSATKQASIGSVDADGADNTPGTVVVNNLQFNGTQNDRVYVVVEDEPSVGNGGTTDERYVSSSDNGGDPEFDLVDYNVADGETITVTVYETDSKSLVLKTDTGTASP